MVAALKPALYPCMVARALLLGAWDLRGVGVSGRSGVDVFDDWETEQGRRGQNRRLGVRIRTLDGRFRRLGDQDGRFRRLGDRK